MYNVERNTNGTIGGGLSMQTQVDIEQLKDVFKSLFTKNVFGDLCVRTHNGVSRLISERTTRKVKKS